jgi:excinuclease UvrABC helicase subunit UvrB
MNDLERLGSYCDWMKNEIELWQSKLEDLIIPSDKLTLIFMSNTQKNYARECLKNFREIFPKKSEEYKVEYCRKYIESYLKSRRNLFEKSCFKNRKMDREMFNSENKYFLNNFYNSLSQVLNI